MNAERNDTDRQLTFRELISRLTSYFLHIWSKKWKIILGAVVFTVILTLYNVVKRPSYTARTTFVLENSSSMGGLGQFSSLASLAGVSLNGLSEGSVLFQIDNIQELYRSRRMIEETLLKPSNQSGFPLLIDFFAEVSDLKDRWVDRMSNDDLNFAKPREQFSRTQDSVLMVLTEMIQENHLMVSKPSRKLSVLAVSFSHKDEALAKDFNENLVETVNDFYIRTNTKKARESLSLLQHQTDSVKKVLDAALLELAKETERIPNANKLLVTTKVPIQKLNIDVQTSGVVYAEMVKNLEIAKTSLRNTTPLIQIIDYPILPLEDNTWSYFKIGVLGALLGGIFVVFYFTMIYIYSKAMVD